MAEAALATVAIKAAVDTVVGLANNFYEKWRVFKNLKGDAKDVADQVENVCLLVKHFASKQFEKGDERAEKRLETLAEKVETIQGKSEPLLKKLTKKSVLRKAFHFVVGSSTAAQIKELRVGLQDIINSILEEGKLSEAAEKWFKQPPSHKIADKDGRKFWETHIGEGEWSGPFYKLLAGYEKEFVKPSAATTGDAPQKHLKKEHREAFFYALCWEADVETIPQRLRMDEEEVSCFKFNAFCERYSWPFAPEDLPAPPVVRVVHSVTDRLAVADMCLGLQSDFSNRQMRQIMEFVRKMVDSVVEHMESTLAKSSVDGHVEYRSESGGYGPYYLMELASAETTKDEQKKFRSEQMRCFAADYLLRKQAEKEEAELPKMDAAHQESERTVRDVLDENRRLWSGAFLRFATLWKLGRLQEEMFEGLDFPGTNRAIEFMKYCEVLDEANLRLTIRKNFERPKTDPSQKDAPKDLEKWNLDAMAWEKSRPEVYSFLRAWIEYKDEKEAAARPANLFVADVPSGRPATTLPKRAAGLPTPVQFGGIVTPLNEDGTPKEVRRARTVARLADTSGAHRHGDVDPRAEEGSCALGGVNTEPSDDLDKGENSGVTESPRGPQEFASAPPTPTSAN